MSSRSSSSDQKLLPQFQIYAPLDLTQQILMNQLTTSRKPPTKQAVIALAAACEAITSFLIQSSIESQIRAIECRLENKKSVDGLLLSITPRDLKTSMFTDGNMGSFFRNQKVVLTNSGVVGGIQKCLMPKGKRT